MTTVHTHDKQRLIAKRVHLISNSDDDDDDDGGDVTWWRTWSRQSKNVVSLSPSRLFFILSKVSVVVDMSCAYVVNCDE
jgi:hypothetical protein